jgi:hypothetical protein
VDGAEYPQIDFLGEVEGFVAIAQQVHRQLNDHALMFGHQLGAGVFVAGRTALHEGRFASTYLCPCDAGGLFH